MVFGLNSSYSFFPLVFSKYTGGTHINKPVCLFVFANLSFVTEAQSREVRRMENVIFPFLQWEEKHSRRRMLAHVK